MKKQSIPTMCAAWSVVLLSLCNLSARPNILLITADDMHWDTVGAYGCPVAATSPVIDRSAAEGFRYNYTYVPILLCTPSRQVMLSGKSSDCSGNTTLALGS